ncbi:MAG: hypothetical protein ACRDXX_13995 [Stackebrandtia sp.]
MGRVADKLNALTVDVTSPDADIQARLKAGQLEHLRLRPGAYDSYAERDLERQLARTAVLLYVGHERGVRRVLDQTNLHFPTEPSQARNEAQRRYLEKERTISVCGSTPRELVRFKINGMAAWRCRIADGALQELTESAFVAEVCAAARDLLRRNKYEKALLKYECFGVKP